MWSDPGVLVGLIGAVVSLVGLAFGTRYTARMAAKSQAITAQIEEKKLDASTWERQTASLQTQVDSWRQDNTALRENMDRMRRDHEAEMTKVQARFQAMEDELTSMRRQRAQEQQERAAMIHWIRTVVGLLRATDLHYPPPPPGIADTDPGSRRAPRRQ